MIDKVKEESSQIEQINRTTWYEFRLLINTKYDFMPFKFLHGTQNISIY